MQALLDTARVLACCQARRRRPKRTPKIARRRFRQARERFIPVSRHGLRAKLVAMLAESGGDRKAWGRALDCLAAWRHQEHRKRLLDLIEDYLPFSPDSDTANLIELDVDGARQGAGRVHRRHREAAGRKRISCGSAATTCSACSIEQSPYGLNLKVDLSEFDEALLYYRGTGTIVREERNPWRLYLRKDRLEVPIFERLFLLLKLKPAETRIAEIMAATQVGPRARRTRGGEGAGAFPARRVERLHLRQDLQAHPADRHRDAVSQHARSPSGRSTS